eukprot:TRINITY_DN11498_c0_g1_i1.p1 TRINITY_DN11498_c0_g1~~TRINITY_DN11498_c0_g1_i1.p1  ORF type:complete len:268 (-),score=65.54 TRINITY_DN11498_c0_g1_i1:92-895(-)
MMAFPVAAAARASVHVPMRVFAARGAVTAAPGTAAATPRRTICAVAATAASRRFATGVAPSESNEELDYLKQQELKLATLKRREADIAAGRTPEGESSMPGFGAWCGWAGLILGGVGIYWYMTPATADPKAQAAFLEEKEAEEGVVKLPSGLMYKVLQVGEGLHHPTQHSPCACHYRGTLIDGTEFDSSYARGEPAIFAPNQVIKAWTEAMQLMVEGDKWELYVPAKLGYGDKGQGSAIPAGAVLVFEIEIVMIRGTKVAKRRKSGM